MKPHKHAELIKQWADGHPVQVYGDMGWKDIDQPTWNSQYEYRIKPDEPKPPVVRWLWSNKDGVVSLELMSEDEAKGYPHYPIKFEWSRTEFPE
jgi:hypothetical protein